MQLGKLELLAPGGDVDSVKAAILAGADAVYCGLGNFNARARATNISFDQLNGLIRLAHQHDCQIFLTLNILILEQEIAALFKLLNQLINSKIDGVIVQDLGLFYLLKHHFPSLDVHASTQTTTHNSGQIELYHQLGASRVNLCRELSLQEIKPLAQQAHQRQMKIEAFVHGSICIGFSGQCYFSSVTSGCSGNRGLCSQPCRDAYQPGKAAKNYPLNLKDNCAYNTLPQLIEAGVDSLKIEGRIKKYHYVHSVVSSWRKQIDRYLKNQPQNTDLSDLYTVFNRDFTDEYLTGSISSKMFIDNPKDYSAEFFSKARKLQTETELKQVKRELYDKKTRIIQSVGEQINAENIDQLAVNISFSGKLGQQLTIKISAADQSFSLISELPLQSADQMTIIDSDIEKRLVNLQLTDYRIHQVDLGETAQLYLPFKQLTQLKNQIELRLNHGQKKLAEVARPQLKKQPAFSSSQLTVLISDTKQLTELSAIDNQSLEIYLQLPEGLADKRQQVLEDLQNNPQLIPYFPAMLIGEDYAAAEALLHQLKPAKLVTNNSGVGWLAGKLGIEWIAGPQMNLSNSFALQCLKDEFNCSGAFLSNELNRLQLKQIICPQDFQLHYQIFYPRLLMSSRQCFFHQTTGCKKTILDNKCLDRCKRKTRISNLDGSEFVIDKKAGSYNRIYSNQNCLNLDLLKELPGRCSHYMIDLRPIATDTEITEALPELIAQFQDAINPQQSENNCTEQLQQMIQLTANNQYRKGL